MTLSLVTAPTALPVSLRALKKHLRVDHVDDDATIDALAHAAAGHLDGHTGILGRALMRQTWLLKAWSPENGRLRLPLPPVRSVSSVKYLVDGAETTLAADSWRLGEDAIGAFVTLEDGYSWPAYDCREDAWRVTFVAGYADTDAEPLPEAVRQAITLLVAHWYENREPVNIGNITSTLPFTVSALLAPFTVRTL